jgi:DNA-binding transcriptional regulator YdaS (Cro superfamily)
MDRKLLAEIDRAIEDSGGVTIVADRLGITPSRLCNWKTRGVPPDWCIRFEDAVGRRVTRYQLQPKVFGKAA